MNPPTTRDLRKFAPVMSGYAMVLLLRVDMPPAPRNLRLLPGAPWPMLWILPMIGACGVVARTVAARRYQ